MGLPLLQTHGAALLPHHCAPPLAAGRVEVSRALGDRQFKGKGRGGGMVAVPDVTPFALGPRDAFALLGCDGFWGVFGAQDAVEFAARELWGRGRDAKQVCNRLVHEAIRERRCADNCTVMLVCFGAAAAAEVEKEGAGAGS